MLGAGAWHWLSTESGPSKNTWNLSDPQVLRAGQTLRLRCGEVGVDALYRRVLLAS